jgi:DNA-binding response OmpR family regulator
MKILVAEDDKLTREGLAEVLETEGFEVATAKNGAEAVSMFRSFEPDAICLDIMMPELNGYDACRQIRERDRSVPILFISAKSEEIDRVLGLEIGADDFISKPFGVREVVARIRAVLRRARHAAAVAPQDADAFNIGDLRVVPGELRAFRGDQAIDLGPRDVSVLKLLGAHRGKVLDRDMIFDACWGVDYFPNSRTLDQHISQLRKRIEIDPKHPAIIHTVHGVGYRYE